MLGLQWSPEVHVSDVLALIGGIFAIFTLLNLRRQVIIAAAQARHQAAERATSFMVDFTSRFFADREISDLYYTIDYNLFRFDPATYPGTPDDKTLSRLLYMIDSLGVAVEDGMLSLRNVEVISPRILRVLKDNEQVQNMLDWLDKEYALMGRPVPSHAPARRLAENLAKSEARINQQTKK
jgi:hypothetical protein